MKFHDGKLMSIEDALKMPIQTVKNKLGERLVQRSLDINKNKVFNFDTMFSKLAEIRTSSS